MSDNEDLLGDDLGDHSLADYNLGNDEEDQLLADDYESGASQNVPTSIASYADGVVDMVSNDYSRHEIQYSNQPIQYHLQPDTECVVPNITVEVPNTSLPDHSTYAPYEPPHVFESELAVVPPPIPAAPLESPQIVPSEMAVSLANADLGGPRERFISERPPGAQRLPQIRDIPDSLDKVIVPRGGVGPGGRGRTWRSPMFATRFHNHNHNNNPYRRNNMHRGNFNQRPSFPPPQMRPNPPQMQPNPPQIRPEIRPDLPPEIRPEIRHEIRPDLPPQMGPEISPERPILPNMPLDSFRMEMRPFAPRFPQFRPDEPRNFVPNMRPNFERPMFYQQRPPFRPFGPPLREVAPNSINHLPQVTLRHPMPGMPGPKGPMNREPEVRMLPVQLPPNLPPGGLAGKKVLINPHFKGNFQPPAEGLSMPAYIPTRIQKTPPLSPTLESKFGPIKDIDDAAERFIAEQRNALARAAQRKFPRRSPQRYIENTTIEIENELAPRPARPRDDADLLRRQEEFINANRAGLRRRMRSPTPPRRSVSPRRSPERARPRLDAARPPLSDEDNEYRRRLREQESLREKVLRAKEVRRRKNAVALHQQNKDRDRLEKEKETPKPEEPKPEVKPSEPLPKPDTTRISPEKPALESLERERSPVREAEVNSTCENLTPPREDLPKPSSPERNLTPPLPKLSKYGSDDDLDLILGDIDGILSDDDDDTGRFKDKAKPEPPKPKQVDLRSKLPPKTAETKKPPRQKIVFHEKEKEERKKKDKSPPRRTIVTSSTKTDDAEKKALKNKEKSEASKERARQKIIFDNKQKEEKDKDEAPKPPFSNRRVILQRRITQQTKEKSVFTRIEIKTDPSKPNPGIFNRAVRTIGKDSRIVVKKEEPQVEYESDSDIDEDKLLEEEVGMIAVVTNLPHGMTDTRMKTLAGNDVQSLNLDKEDRSAKITFKTTVAAESFKKKFNNKMVAASRLTVTLR